MSAESSSRKLKRIEVLEQRIGYSFKNTSYLERALTHASVRKHNSDDFHYERLEFLGDRVLGICVAELLFNKFPRAVEGELSLRLNALVQGKTLAAISDELKLHEFIRTGGDLKYITGKRMRSVRADVLEALIASIYLDGGLKPVSEFISRFWAKRLDDVKTARRDPKTELQEWAHARQLPSPKYVEIERSGPDHDPEFTVTVKNQGFEDETGIGRSKRSAEQDAARKMLIREGVWSADPESGKL